MGSNRLVGVVRAIQLMRLLERREGVLTWEQLAERFGVTDRTIRRDVEVLQKAGARIRTAWIETPSGQQKQGIVGIDSWTS